MTFYHPAVVPSTYRALNTIFTHDANEHVYWKQVVRERLAE